MTQARFVPVPFVLVNGSFFNRSVDDRKSLGQKLFGLLLVIVLDGLSESLDLGAQQRPIAPVDRVSFETSPPLSKGGFMISHFSLLNRNDMIKYLLFYVNRPLTS